MTANPQEVRNGVRTLYESIGLTPFQSADLEIGIYNNVLQLAECGKTPKNWGCPNFLELYMAKARNTYANLDKESYIGNPELITRLLGKEFKPHDVAWMKHDNIFPVFWNELMDQENKRRNAEFGLKKGQETDMFQCGKCKKRKCSYYELQTRSGDESMTIFISCLVCGNRWRTG